jgi:PAS domain S-box-containing protein
MKLAEMEMHISADFFDATSDSILIHDLDGKLIYFNETAYKTRGYTKEEFQALSIQDLETPGNSRFFDSKMRDLVNAGSATFETEDLCKEKTVVPVEIHAKVIEFDGEKLVLTVTRDISERKKIEEEKNNLLHNLGERVKELNCIYGVSRIFEKSDILPEEALPETVKLFSPAMQYPSITCARIVVENKEFSTKNFKETPWKLQAEIKANGKKTGFVGDCLPRRETYT